MASPFSWRQSWVVKSFNPSVTDTHDLKPFELGFLNYDSCKTLGGFTQSPFVRFALGSPNADRKVSSHPKIASLIDTNRTVSYKSEKIYGKNLQPARIAKPSRAESNQVIYLGYDGLNECKSLDFKCGRTYMVNVQIIPTAATELTWPKGISDQVEITVKACPECGDDCIAPNLCGSVIDELVAKLNNSWVAPYVKAEKVITCCPAQTPLPKTLFEAYCLTLCDEGDALALARVQNQYKDKTVVRKSRKGTQSTYEFWQLASLGAPVDFSQTELIVPDCPTCDPGYTTVPATKALIVTIDNDGMDVLPAAQLAAVQAKIPTATAAIKLSFDGSVSVYAVNVPTTWVDPGQVSETLIQDTGVVTQAHCTLTTPILTAWTLCGSKYKVTRKLCLQLENPDCGGTPANELTEMQAAYANNPMVVAGTVALTEAGTCQSLFEIQQYCDNLMEDGCDTVGVAEFKDLVAYKGHVWSICPCEGWTVSPLGCPIPPVVVDEDCRCGIKFSGAMVDLTTSNCVFDPMNSVNYDAVRFEVSVYEILGPGNPVGVLYEPTAITKSRTPKYRYLSGEEVYREIIMYRMHHENEVYFNPRTNLKMNLTEAMEFGVDPKAFYYAVYIPWNRHGHSAEQHMGQQLAAEMCFYFAESDYSVMQQFLVAYNKYAVSAGVNLPPIQI